MVCACGQVHIASNLICLHAVSSVILMASLWLLWLLRNVVTTECCRGLLLLLWYVLTDSYSLLQGDGIEFKKKFRQVKDLCADIICKPPPIQ